MTDAPVLSVAGLSKRYARDRRLALRYALADTAAELWPRRGGGATPRPGEFLALDGLSFELRRGEALAVLGRNGAGKSTLLRIAAGLIKPDAGEVRVRGRTSAMIELTAGFNPALTGRENVRLGATLHGLSDREGGRLVDDVADFAGLEEFIDSPVQSYSAGMKARLAYAVHAALEPDLLLVDEVLAVGDLDFQHKCLNHMRRFLERGGALLFVSHSPHQVQAVCDRGLLLDHGRAIFAGAAAEALGQMFELRLARREAPAPAAMAEGPLAIEALAADPAEGDFVRTGEPLRIALRYRTERAIEAAWAFSLWTADGWVCVTGARDPRRHRLPAGRGELVCSLPRLPMLGGRYLLRAALLDPDSFHPLCLYGYQEPGVAIDVRSPPDPAINAQMQRGQLVSVDVDWA